MKQSLISVDEVRAGLAPFRRAEMLRLASLSGVPFTTLAKIRSAETKDPGIETVRKFWPFVAAIARHAKKEAEREARFRTETIQTAVKRSDALAAAAPSEA